MSRPRWHRVFRATDGAESTDAMNTATGVMVERRVDVGLPDGGTERVTTTFIPGERWNPETEEFEALAELEGGVR